ncbi:unnamed protein product [Prorocentrum cordatum]|uniref:Uncharacterized protein n=2 Tax=Prorocentrum cordatum TaxID=2364126 RepID=A0ABN9SGF1_9DINO|nr:unnamed protein product [Polarella glacialis]
MANSDVDECPTPSRNVLPYQSLSVTVQMLDETDLRAPTSTRPLDLEVGAVLAETQHQWDACRTEHESRPTLPTRRGCPALAGQLPCSSRGIDWILGWLPPALPDTPKRTRSQTRSEREDGTCKLEVLGRGSGAFTSRRVGDVGVLRSPSPARLYSSSPLESKFLPHMLKSGWWVGIYPSVLGQATVQTFQHRPNVTLLYFTQLPNATLHSTSTASLLVRIQDLLDEDRHVTGCYELPRDTDRWPRVESLVPPTRREPRQASALPPPPAPSAPRRPGASADRARGRRSAALPAACHRRPAWRWRRGPPRPRSLGRPPRRRAS